VQFAEHAEHPHVHFHIIPRMADLPDDHRSTGIFSVSRRARRGTGQRSGDE
jgi:diadenosine tetraphosphate (Ap4A) HIT family hydrolase